MSKDIYHHGLGLINKSITSEVLRSLRHYLWKELTDTILEVGSFLWCNEPHTESITPRPEQDWKTAACLKQFWTHKFIMVSPKSVLIAWPCNLLIIWFLVTLTDQARRYAADQNFQRELTDQLLWPMNLERQIADPQIILLELIRYHTKEHMSEKVDP